VPVHELNKTTAFARGDLNVGDLAETLEEGSELVLGHISRETANENGGIVGIGKLVHWLHRVEGPLVLLVLGHAPATTHGISGLANLSRHLSRTALALAVLVRAGKRG
jgi:hypothetical protein